MDVLLVSGRGRGADPHPSREQTARLVTDLAAGGHAVRWICPVNRTASGPAVQLPDSGAFIPVVTRAKPFRKVATCGDDATTDRELSLQIRARLPDVVHVTAFGGHGSVVSLWIAQRLGVPAIATVDARELVCHRGTLIDHTGQACAQWDSAERCHACCRASFDGGLSPAQSLCARILSAFEPWSPFPHPDDFTTRRSLMTGGLAAASHVVVRRAEDVPILVDAGISQRRITVLRPDHGAAALVDVYTTVVGSRLATSAQ